jgi:triacylglycerol lipase
MYDQRLALRWIQENIGAFHGDPSKVMIQGETVGRNSVLLHFWACGGRDDGLFRAGVSESGEITQHPTMDQRSAMYQEVLNKTNCANTSDTLKCLKRVDALDIARACQGHYLFPT